MKLIKVKGKNYVFEKMGVLESFTLQPMPTVFQFTLSDIVASCCLSLTSVNCGEKEGDGSVITMKMSGITMPVSGRAFPAELAELVVQLVLGLHLKHCTYIYDRRSSRCKRGQKCRSDMESWWLSVGIVFAWMAGC